MYLEENSFGYHIGWLAMQNQIIFFGSIWTKKHETFPRLELLDLLRESAKIVLRALTSLDSSSLEAIVSERWIPVLLQLNELKIDVAIQVGHVNQ